MKRLMSISGMAVSCLALSAFAQDPANITGTGNFANLDRGDTYVSPAGDVLLDQLYLVDGQAYFAGNGNCWGGEAVFGSTNDLQLCTDMDVADGFEMTDVTTDSVTFFGGSPAAMRAGLFADVGGPDDAYSYDADWGISSSSTFTDTVFGFLGVRATGSGSAAGNSAGHWYVMGQPITTSGDGDWHYTCRGNQDQGDDCYGRDGDRGIGGYGTTSWTSFAALGFGNGDASMQVIGTLGGGGGLTLDIAGECPGTLTATACGANEGDRIYFIYGFAEGTTRVPGCPGLEADIRGPKIAGVSRADASGCASASGRVPAGACGRTLVQAINIDKCEKSNVVGI